MGVDATLGVDGYEVNPITNPATSPAITGGTINGATIGATTPAAGTFTTVTTTGNATLGSGDFADTHTINGAVNVLGGAVAAPNSGFVAGNNVGLGWNGDGNKAMVFDAAGNLHAKTGFYPATPAAASQSATSVYGGTGAPVNGEGANGDIYIRSDGGALTTIYQRRAGAWVGIL
jgi:hypothetical protein